MVRDVVELCISAAVEAGFGTATSDVADVRAQAECDVPDQSRWWRTDVERPRALDEQGRLDEMTGPLLDPEGASGAGKGGVPRIAKQSVRH